MSKLKKKYYTMNVNEYLNERLVKHLNEYGWCGIPSLICETLKNYVKREHGFVSKNTRYNKTKDYTVKAVRIPIDLGDFINSTKDDDITFSAFCTKIVLKELFNENYEIVHRGQPKTYNFKISDRLSNRMNELKIDRTILKYIILRYLQHNHQFEFHGTLTPCRNHLSQYVYLQEKVGNFIMKIKKEDETLGEWCNNVLYKIFTKYQRRKEFERNVVKL